MRYRAVLAPPPVYTPYTPAPPAFPTAFPPAYSAVASSGPSFLPPPAITTYAPFTSSYYAPATFAPFSTSIFPTNVPAPSPCCAPLTSYSPSSFPTFPAAPVYAYSTFPSFNAFPPPAASTYSPPPAIPAATPPPMVNTLSAWSPAPVQFPATAFAAPTAGAPPPSGYYPAPTLGGSPSVGLGGPSQFELPVGYSSVPPAMPLTLPPSPYAQPSNRPTSNDPPSPQSRYGSLPSVPYPLAGFPNPSSEFPAPASFESLFPSPKRGA